MVKAEKKKKRYGVQVLFIVLEWQERHVPAGDSNADRADESCLVKKKEEG